MTVKVIGLIIGILISCFGIYYLVKEKNDSESKKIYSIASALGIIIFTRCLVLLILYKR